MIPDPGRAALAAAARLFRRLALLRVQPRAPPTRSFHCDHADPGPLGR